MAELSVQQKFTLGETLGVWYRHFGKVAPRRPYHEDDEGGSGAGSPNPFESHPLLDQMPPGASSDLTYILDEHNKDAIDAAEKREDQASPELKKRLEEVLALKHGKKFNPQNMPTR